MTKPRIVEVDTNEPLAAARNLLRVVVLPSMHALNNEIPEDMRAAFWGCAIATLAGAMAAAVGIPAAQVAMSGVADMLPSLEDPTVTTTH